LPHTSRSHFTFRCLHNVHAYFCAAAVEGEEGLLCVLGSAITVIAPLQLSSPGQSQIEWSVLMLFPTGMEELTALGGSEGFGCRARELLALHSHCHCYRVVGPDELETRAKARAHSYNYF
jgi:hypothetical protein